MRRVGECFWYAMIVRYAAQRVQGFLKPMKGFVMQYLIAVVCSLIMLSIMPSEARAATLIDASHPQVMVKILQSYGSAELKVDEEGAPFIDGEMRGAMYSFYFYGCTQQRCPRAQFQTAWRPNGKNNVAHLNAWNRSKLFGKAYQAPNGDIVLSMPIMLADGVTQVNLDGMIRTWVSVVRSFWDHLEK